MKEHSSHLGGVFSMAVVSVLFLLVGGLMTFFPTMKILYFSYIISAFLFAGGLALFIRYFLNEEYKNLTNYDFSLGISLVSISVLVLLNAKEISNHVLFAIGLLIFLDAVFFLQYAVQLRMLKKPFWQVIILFSICTMIVAWMELLDFQHIFTNHPQALYIILMIFGALGLLAMLLVYFQIRSFQKEEEKALHRNLEEEPEEKEIIVADETLEEANEATLEE